MRNIRPTGLIPVLLLVSLLILGRPAVSRAALENWWVDGFIEGSFYQPHGKFEPYPGVFDNDRAIGRVGLETALEIHQTYIPRLFVYADLLFHLGRRDFENDYRWDLGPISYYRRWGAGLTLHYEPNFELRVTHSQWNDPVLYVGEPLTWNAIQVRWNYDYASVPEPGSGWRLRGWLEGSYYPPHNEYDPNPRIKFDERVVARYGLEGANELRLGALPNLILYFNFFACFGDSRPQIDYNYKADPIGMRINFGVGWRFGKEKDLQLRLTHERWIDLGGMRVDRVAWTGLQIRWTFSLHGGTYPEWRKKRKAEKTTD